MAPINVNDIHPANGILRGCQHNASVVCRAFSRVWIDRRVDHIPLIWIWRNPLTSVCVRDGVPLYVIDRERSHPLWNGVVSVVAREQMRI